MWLGNQEVPKENPDQVAGAQEVVQSLKYVDIWYFEFIKNEKKIENHFYKLCIILLVILFIYKC